MLPSVSWFHSAFCNTMTDDETKAAFEAFVVPESRNIPRSATKADGAIDFKQPHVPVSCACRDDADTSTRARAHAHSLSHATLAQLLFIAGEDDTIIPHSLVEKNCKAYTSNSVRVLKVPASRAASRCRLAHRATRRAHARASHSRRSRTSFVAKLAGRKSPPLCTSGFTGPGSSKINEQAEVQKKKS